MNTWRFEALGTAWQIDCAQPLDDRDRQAIADRIERFDRMWSRFRPDSLIASAASAPGRWDFGAEGQRLFDLFDALHDITDGAVNPLIGARLADLGYDASYSLVAKPTLADVPAWATLKRRGTCVELDQPAVIDVGAAGKGMLVDTVAELLTERGHTSFTVDASGDVAHRGTGPIRIGLEHPSDPSLVIGVVDLHAGQALCASGTNRRAWGEGLHHVLDANSGQPTRDVVATWVVSEASCMLADGLATALFFADPDRVRQHFEFDYVRVHADGRVSWSPTLQGEVFT